MDNDKTTTLYLMRHGETEDNVRRVIQGHNDSPLTQEGISCYKGQGKNAQGYNVRCYLLQ